MNTRRFCWAVLLALLLSAPAFAQEEDSALYAVGALGASNLYNTYFLLGTLADGYPTAAYTAQFADELARDIIGLNESSREVLQRLIDQKTVVGEDKQLVLNMITAHELLTGQAWGLISYVEDSSDTEAWFSYRRRAWEIITDILGIEPPLAEE